MDILGDCGSPDPGSIPGPGPQYFSLPNIFYNKNFNA